MLWLLRHGDTEWTERELHTGRRDLPLSEGGRGYSCIAEIRVIETLRNGIPSTPFLRFGDSVRIEMFDDNGSSLFGAIEQTVARYCGAPPGNLT